MKDPTSKQFKAVINNLISVMDGSVLDMCVGELRTKDQPCGTPMCVGGHYAIAKGLFHVNDLGLYDFSNGADLMANDLGFWGMYNLECWAEMNSNNWGNPHGGELFSSILAYKDPETGKLPESLKDIANFLMGVHNRTCTRAKPMEVIA